MEILGVDIGGVIIDRMQDNLKIWDSDEYLETPVMEGSFDAIKQLKEERFKNNLHIVSKVGTDESWLKTREWLLYHNFYNRTGMTPEQLHFCRERKAKAPICEKLNITIFIDDRLENLGYLLGHVETLYLFKPDSDELEEHKELLGRNWTMVQDWEQLTNELLSLA